MSGRGLAVLDLPSGFPFEQELLLVLPAIAVDWVLPSAQKFGPSAVVGGVGLTFGISIWAGVSVGFDGNCGALGVTARLRVIFRPLCRRWRCRNYLRDFDLGRSFCWF